MIQEATAPPRTRRPSCLYSCSRFLIGCPAARLCSKDQTLRLWDTVTGSCLEEVTTKAATHGLLPSEDGLRFQVDAKLRYLSSSGLATDPFESSMTSQIQFRKQSTGRILVENDRVLRDGERHLWLPPDC